MNVGRTFWLVMVGGFLLAGCGKKEVFTPLKHGEKLRSECLILQQKYSSGEIPPAAWPGTIKELKPSRVVAESNKIRIFLPQPDQRYQGGYDVFTEANPAPSTKGVWIQKTKVKGIYIFQM